MRRDVLEQSLFVIVSAVHVSERPLSYSEHRSTYSTDERLVQTYATIASVRRRAPWARTVLLELGRTDVAAQLASSVDAYHYLGGHRLVRMAADSRHKGLGEAVGLLAFLRGRDCFGDSRFVFKISGRYRLTERFAPSCWHPGRFNVLLRDGGCSTVLYGLPAAQRARFAGVLVRSLPGLMRGESIEVELARRLGPAGCLHPLETLGVEGEVAPDGMFISY